MTEETPMKMERVRGEIAEMLGWTRVNGHEKVPLQVGKYVCTYWEKTGEPDTTLHPVGTTLDELASLWREHAKGWRLKICIREDGQCFATAWENQGQYREAYADNGDTLETLTHLLHAVLKATRGEGKNG